MIESLKEILEVEELDLTAKFEDFEEWDSLTILSVIAMVDSDYKLTINKETIEKFENVGAFCDYILKNAH